MLLHKIIKHCLALSELEIRVIIHKSKVICKGSRRLSCDLPDSPKPCNVKVAVTCHNDLARCRILDFLNLAPEYVDRFRNRGDESLAAEVKVKLMNGIVHSVEKA